MCQNQIISQYETQITFYNLNNLTDYELIVQLSVKASFLIQTDFICHHGTLFFDSKFKIG